MEVERWTFRHVRGTEKWPGSGALNTRRSHYPRTGWTGARLRLRCVLYESGSVVMASNLRDCGALVDHLLDARDEGWGVRNRDGSRGSAWPGERGLRES